MRDLHNNLGVNQLLISGAVTASTDTASLDLQGFNAVELVLLVGAETDILTGTKFASFKIQESDDNVTFTDVVDSSLVLGDIDTTGVFVKIDAAAKTDQAYKVGYLGNSRYIRVAVTLNGTHSTGLAMAVCGVTGHPNNAPV